MNDEFKDGEVVWPMEWGVAEGSPPYGGGGTDLRVRTKDFALRVIKLCDALPASAGGRVLGNQLIRSGTSVGAHYREACRARSQAEFISKIQVALQELDESSYWLELIVEGEYMTSERLQPLMQETNELLAILTKCVRTAKASKAGRNS